MLIKFIKSEKDLGINELEIRSRLSLYGYSTAEINNAFNYCYSSDKIRIKQRALIERQPLKLLPGRTAVSIMVLLFLVAVFISFPSVLNTTGFVTVETCVKPIIINKVECMGDKAILTIKRNNAYDHYNINGNKVPAYSLGEWKRSINAEDKYEIVPEYKGVICENQTIIYEGC